MTQRIRRYWAIRSDRNNKIMLFKELLQGRLRQGWGYDYKQDLRIVKDEIDKGGNWWERLSESQKKVLPHHRMLSSFDDSIHPNDWILIPNMSEDGVFRIAEVSGSYYFEPLRLLENQDVNELEIDYGHVLPVKLLTDHDISKYADNVHAEIRSTLRTPMRLWNLDRYGSHLEQIIEKYKDGQDFSSPLSGQSRLEKAWEISLNNANKLLQEHLGLELDKRFQAAEWEEPIVGALQKLYPGCFVQGVGGPQEHGADILVHIPNYFSDIPWIIIIQVKNYTGDININVLEQLRAAYIKYSLTGNILSLVVMTTADKTTDDFSEAENALSKELNVPIHIVLRDNLLEMLSEGFISKTKYM